MNPVNNTFEEVIEENKRLKKAVAELSILNEIATAISSSFSLEEIINLIVWKCIKHLNVEEAAVMLLDEKTPDNPFQTMIRKADSKVKTSIPLRLDTQITGWLLKNRKPLIVNDISGDGRFKYSNSGATNLKSFLSVPMLLKGSIIGIITVFNKKGNLNFNEEDQRLLSIIAAQSAQTIENARLLEEEKSLLQIRKELQMAAEIQKKILPKEIPKISGYDIAAINIPAREVGGDYYDFIRVNGKIVFCLGDITGKGIPAALLMANLQATFRSQAQINDSIKEIVCSSNKLLTKSTEADKFATLFAGMLDLKSGILTYCNAGHDDPYFLMATGEIKRLSKGGIILGFMDTAVYEEEKTEMRPGDMLVVFSDGITETMNKNEELFGEHNLKSTIMNNRDLTADKLIRKIISETENFSGGEAQSDDKTLLIVRRIK